MRAQDYMPNMEKAARFERFARMRLEGRSDLVYRAYDLMTDERNGVSLPRYLRAAGQYIPESGTREAMVTLQHRFTKWGFPVMTLDQIKDLLHEFWAYERIKIGGKKNWPYRDPDEARALYDQNDKVIKARGRAN